MKTCIRCNENKRSIGFPKEKSRVCTKCRTLDSVEKGKLFTEKEDLGIEALNKEENIEIFNKYLRPNRTMSYDNAISFISGFSYKVINDTSVYLMEFRKPEAEDTLTRINVLERDGFECFYCGDDAKTVDHLIPKSKGGLYTEENLVASCEICNIAKASRNMTKEQVLIESNKFKKRKAEGKVKTKKKKDNKFEKQLVVDFEDNKKKEILSLEDMINESLNTKKQKWQ